MMGVDINKVPAFYQGYVRQTGNGKLVPMLLKSGDDLVETCKSLTEAKALYRYAEGKWSIKDLVQHMIDSERVFVYRALRFSRNDNTELSGFDQDHYVPEAKADNRPLHQLLTEFNNLRASTIDFFSALGDEERERTGVSNGVEMSVEMLGLIISGHTFHHLNIIKEKYLK